MVEYIIIFRISSVESRKYSEKMINRVFLRNLIRIIFELVMFRNMFLKDCLKYSWENSLMGVRFMQ